MNKYYYLIASLPVLHPEKKSDPIDFRSLFETIQENLEDEDKTALEYLHHRNDIRNFISVLAELRRVPSPYNSFFFPYSKEPSEFHHYKRKSSVLPDFIADTLKEFKDLGEGQSLHEIEKSLTGSFYNITGHSRNHFVRSYFEFDHKLRNLSVMLNAGRYGAHYAHVLNGNSADAEKELISDIGVTTRPAQVESLMQAIKNENAFQIEMAWDKIRWEFIDTHTALSNFGVTYILGYYLKLQFIQRWALLEGDGSHRMDKLADEIMEEYEMPERA